jgi:hypothetical protein
MANNPYRPLNPGLYPDETIEPSGSAVAWSAIWAGAIVTTAVSLVLLAVGSGFGLIAVSPWPGVGTAPTTFTIAAGLWLVFTQWISSLFGGYVAGRTRTRWSNLHTDEVFFRDTVHGLLTWSLATLVVVGIAILAGSIAGSAAVDAPISREAADAARAIAAKFAFFTAVSLIVGAFIASAAAAYGGHLRDDHP